MTRASRLLCSATFDPDTLKIIGRAFDEAWNSIAANVGDNPLAIEATRLKLANAILTLAKEDCRDVQELKNAALPIITREYRTI